MGRKSRAAAATGVLARRTRDEGPGRRPEPSVHRGRGLRQSPTFFAASAVALAADFAVFRALVAVALALLWGALDCRRAAVAVVFAVFFAARFAVLAVLRPAFSAWVPVVLALLFVVRADATVSWVDF